MPALAGNEALARKVAELKRRLRDHDQMQEEKFAAVCRDAATADSER